MAKLDQITVDDTLYELVPEIAPLFDNAKAYNVGDCVINDAKFYRFTAAHAAGAWVGTDAEAITVGNELTGLKADLTDLNGILTETEDLTSAFTAGYYHSTAQSKGKITPNNLVAGEQWSYIFREVHAGEKYVVTAYSSTATARAYCLTNTLYVPVIIAPSPRSAVDFVIDVEADGYLVINNNSNLQSNPKLLKVTDNLENLSKSVSALQDSVSTTEQDIANINNDISSLQESEGKTTDLANGYALLGDLFDFKIGRWGLEVSPSAAAHSSTVIARTLNAVSVLKPTAIICDLGYRFYNVISSDDEGASWAVESERICTIMLTPGKLYRLNAQYINQTTLTDTDEVTTHIKVLDVITSEYEKYKSTFSVLKCITKLLLLVIRTQRSGQLIINVGVKSSGKNAA